MAEPAVAPAEAPFDAFSDAEEELAEEPPAEEEEEEFHDSEEDDDEDVHLIELAPKSKAAFTEKQLSNHALAKAARLPLDSKLTAPCYGQGEIRCGAASVASLCRLTRAPEW